MKRTLTINLKYKFALFTSILILMVCVILSVFLLDKVEKELRRQIHLRGMSIITNFAQNAKYSIMTQNRVFLSSLVEHEISKSDIVHVIVINEKGTIVGHNNPSLIGQKIEDETTLHHLKSLTQATMRKTTIASGETVYDFIMPILEEDIYTEDRYADPTEARKRMPDQTNLGLIRIGISFRKLESSMQETYQGVMYISLFIAAISILLAFWYGKLLVRPLAEMTRIAGRLSAGYLDERVEISSNDEIGILADNFNTMAQSLQESRSNLWKLNKDLEYIVEERTSDLKKAYQDLQQIDELKSTFLSTVSHELRTPLTSILGFAKMIEKQFRKNLMGVIPEEDKKASKAVSTILTNLDIITTESNRLARLINDVLDLAKIESGKMNWKKEKFDLYELFERAFHNLHSLVDESKIHLELRKDSEVIEGIEGDPDRILQVIMNLLSNAIKFTTEGAIICSVQQKDGYIQAYVKDPGVGIEEKDLLKVFEKFQQVGDTLTSKPQGTGLGLPICKEIIEHHNGQIWADSKPKKGSTFYFALPLSEIPVPQTVKEVTFRLENKLSRMAKSERLILIADEDPAIRNLLQFSLEDEGYRTIQAVNGKETYDLAREYPISAILMDIMMYEIDGFDTPHYLKADPNTKEIPIMLLSVVMNKKNEMVLGATSYITSPVSSEKILNRVGETLRKQDLSLTKTTIYFFGFDKNLRREYLTELKTLGVKVIHYDTIPNLVRGIEGEKPTAVFVNFRDSGVSPNQFFKTFRDQGNYKDIPIVTMVHESHIARTIDSTPIRAFSTPSEITKTINELFAKNL